MKQIVLMILNKAGFFCIMYVCILRYVVKSLNSLELKVAFNSKVQYSLARTMHPWIEFFLHMGFVFCYICKSGRTHTDSVCPAWLRDPNVVLSYRVYIENDCIQKNKKMWAVTWNGDQWGNTW